MDSFPASDDPRLTAAVTGSEGGSGSGVMMLRQMEALNRGVVAVRTGTSTAYVGWRLLGTDPTDVAFNLYRSANGGASVKLNASPLTLTTDFVDSSATGLNLNVANEYFVRPVISGVEQDPSESYVLASFAPVQQFLEVSLQRPAGGVVTLPPGTLTPPSGNLNYTYSANDASVGDLDGDGQYEIVLKWDPSNSQDNANEGLTGPVILDAYRLNGDLLWRINLGRNIRAGAHYTQFLVYDFDGDGRAEVVMKTADGTVDGEGTVIGNAAADYRDGYTGAGDGRWGRVLTGPEFLTVFDGLTGAALSTIDFSPVRGSVSSWGDNYGNRVDRFLATVAYLDGTRPSIVMARGYYAKTMLTAYDWRDGEFTQLWTFNSTQAGNGIYAGQGNHNLSVGDVDADGKDEIIYGAAVFDDDGTGIHSTGYGHGDAIHFGDLVPSRPGLEVFQIHEPSNVPGSDLRDAFTGETIYATALVPNGDEGPGRGAAFDIDPNYPGYEFWDSASGSVYGDLGGGVYGPIYAKPGNMHTNFGIWWDSDLLRETLDGTTISNWRYDLTPPGRQNIIFAPANVSSINGTKNNPNLVVDILGDWREEVIWRRSDNTGLQIWTTTNPADNRIYTLMHDPQYRMAVAWQNVAYNQPPHPGFFLGAGMDDPPIPQIYTVQYAPYLAGDYNNNGQIDAADYSVWRDTMTAGGTELTNDPTPGAVDESDFLYWRAHFGETMANGLGQAASASIALAPTDFAASPPTGQPSSDLLSTNASLINVDALRPTLNSYNAASRPVLPPAGSQRHVAAVAGYERLLLLILSDVGRDSTSVQHFDHADQHENLATKKAVADSLDTAIAEYDTWASFREFACKLNL